MQAPIPAVSATHKATVRLTDIAGFSIDDDIPELFDPDEDRGELETYVHIADTWND